MERCTPVSLGVMKVTMTMTNPQFTRPWTVDFNLRRNPAGRIVERICSDKNKTRGDYLDDIKN